MEHLQQITDSGQEVEPEVRLRPDYNLESEPVEWIEGEAEHHFDYISEISRYNKSKPTTYKIYPINWFLGVNIQRF